MTSALGGLLHKLSDAVRDAARDVDRGDEDAAAETISKAVREVREELDAK